MKLNLRSFSLFGGAFLLSTCTQGFAGVFDSLKSEEKNQVMNGKQVIHESRDPIHPHAPWPKFEVFQLIQATPEEAAAVFWDTGNHKNFIPNLKRSDTTMTGKNTADVHYSIELPMMLGTESYVVHNTLHSHQGTYEVSWVGVPNSSFDYSVGSAQFEPLGDATLLTYTSSVNSIRFGSSLAWVVDGVRSQLLQTVDAIVNRTDGEKASHSTLLQQEIDLLRSIVTN